MKRTANRIFGSIGLAAMLAGIAPARGQAEAAGPALGDMSLEQLLAQLPAAVEENSTGQSGRILREIVSRGTPAYEGLLGHYQKRDQYFTAAGNALLLFPAFGDVLLAGAQQQPGTRGQSLAMLARMRENAVPSLLRLLMAKEEAARALGLEQLLAIGRNCPDEADRLFTPILTAPPEVKPRLMAAQGLATGLWPAEAQQAVIQQLAHGDAAMVVELERAIAAGGLPLDEAGPAWVKAFAGADAAGAVNLIMAGPAVRDADLPAAVPILAAWLKGLKGDSPAGQRAAAPFAIAALKRAGKGALAPAAELLKLPETRDAGIELCRQLDADAAPLSGNLAALLDAAETPTERKAALLGALAAIGPGAKGELPEVQRVADPVLLAAKKHALLMISDGWTPAAVPEWKAVRARRVKFTPRAGAEADLVAASDAITELKQASAAEGGAGAAGPLQFWMLYAMAGDVDAAISARALVGVPDAQAAATRSQIYQYAAAAMLRAGRHDVGVDDLNRAIGRYRLGRMMTPPAEGDFATAAMAMLATGDNDAAIALAARVPVDRLKLIQWQAAHQDLDGAMETAMAVPYGPVRISALAAAGNAFGLAGRNADAARAFTLALDAAHMPGASNEMEISGLAVGVAVYGNGLSPSLLKGFYGADDRDISVVARLNAISRLTGMGQLDAALLLAMTAGPDPTDEAHQRLGRLATLLSPALAVGAVRRNDIPGFCVRVQKELDGLYEAAGKNAAGRDGGFLSQYFNDEVMIGQIYLNMNQPRDAAVMLNKAGGNLKDAAATLGGAFDNVSGTFVRLQTMAGNVAGAQGLAEKMNPTIDAANAWCAIAEAQYRTDANAAERSWGRAKAAGGAAAAQADPLIANSRARAAANMPAAPVIQILTAQRVPGQPVPPATQPSSQQGKTLEDAAHAVVDPAARIALIQNAAAQYMQMNPQPNPGYVDRRLPVEFAALMREAEVRLVGNTAANQALRAQAFNVCLLAGQTDVLEPRVASFAAAVLGGPTPAARPSATAPAAPAFDVNTAPPGVLKVLAALQAATGHAGEAKKWVDTIKDGGLRGQLRLSVVRGLLLRTADVMVAQDGV